VTLADTNNLVLRGFSLKRGNDDHRSDILVQSAPVHFARTLGQMLAFLKARIPGPDGKPIWRKSMHPPPIPKRCIRQTTSPRVPCPEVLPARPVGACAPQYFTWRPSRQVRRCSRPSIRPDHAPDCGIERRPHRILSFKCRKSLQQQKALISAGRNMIAASSKGDKLDDGAIHLSNDQPKARSMEKTSNAKASSGKKSPVSIERQLGAAADQSMPSTP